MTKNFQIFLIVFLLSLPFWWGINVLGESLENFLFLQYSQSSLFLAAEIRPPQESSGVSELSINAGSAISIKIDQNGQETILFEKTSGKILPIASLTKLMTAWVVFEYPEYYNLSQEVRVSREAVMQEGDFGLSEGQTVSIRDLLYSILIESSNDAAFALAEALVPKSEAKSEVKVEAFVSLMNLEAKENLGLKNTYFVNPTGLNPKDEGQAPNYSTAQDLVELSKHILLKHPEIFEISKNGSALIFDNYLAVNKNIILNHNTIGGKTGWTPLAGGCILLVQKSKQGEYLINVILGTVSPDSRFEEMEKLIQLTTP